MGEAKTFFEQVPIEVVKEIVKNQLREEGNKEVDKPLLPTAKSKRTGHRGYRSVNLMESNREGDRWRQIAEQASREQDPDKLLKLVDELNRLLMQPKATANSAS